jgi:hypothetical protein
VMRSKGVIFIPIVVLAIVMVFMIAVLGSESASTNAAKYKACESLNSQVARKDCITPPAPPVPKAPKPLPPEAQALANCWTAWNSAAGTDQGQNGNTPPLTEYSQCVQQIKVAFKTKG